MLQHNRPAQFGGCPPGARLITLVAMKKVTAWASRDFRRIWGATTASALGNEVGELALPVLALVWLGASAEELSWVRVATFLPYLALTLWIGCSWIVILAGPCSSEPRR